MRDYVECLPKWAVALQPVSLTISIQMVRPRQAFVSARLAVSRSLWCECGRVLLDCGLCGYGCGCELLVAPLLFCGRPGN